MKKIGLLILTIILVVALVACTSKPEKVKSANATKATEVAEVKLDEELIKKLMDNIGGDLIERAKTAGFKLNTAFRHYAYIPYEGWEPKEDDYVGDLLFVTVEVYAPKTPETTADIDLMRELQYAIIDSDIFELTEEEKVELKSISYSAENREDRITVEDPKVELHFLEFDANAVLTLVYADNDMKNKAHREDWYRTYHWEEFFN